ncbi:MAG: hypothetical protein ABR509_08630 [Candidatus Limnocylindria bacterium]
MSAGTATADADAPASTGAARPDTAAMGWRLALARRIAEAYARHPSVAAAIVGGSTSRGWADRWSDIEIAWCARIAPYPRPLAVAVIRQEAPIEFLWRSDVFLERGTNLLLLYDLLVGIPRRLYATVFALNRVYHRGLKWVHRMTAELRVAPREFNERVQAVSAADPRLAARDLAALVEETYDLIQENAPEVDVDELRRWFRYRRQPWDHEPDAGRPTDG